MSRVPYKLLLQSSSTLERGSYPCSRTQITLGMFRYVASILCRQSTMALFGAFLIHITLGTFYTLSNINSYMTSYIRKHGFPNATYGGTIWISSAFAIGQGVAMIIGGIVERRFSARISCFIGCAMFSLSILATSSSLKYGLLGIVLTYGLLPGFGTGMAYMVTMSNGFAWFPQNKRGFVAGTILAGFGMGTLVFNLVQTAIVNPNNLSPNQNGYFEQDEILNKVPEMLVLLGTVYGAMQFVGCCLLFKAPSKRNKVIGNQDYDHVNGTKNGQRNQSPDGSQNGGDSSYISDIVDEDDNHVDNEDHILLESSLSLSQAIRSRKFIVLGIVYGTITQGVLFVNSMIKEYGQIYIHDDLYLSWTGSIASIANGLGRISWGLAIDRLSFSKTFTMITVLFGFFIFTLPFEMVLSSKTLYMAWTLGIFGSFSGWMAIFPVQVAREFGQPNSALIYGLIFVSQSIGSVVTAFSAHYIIDTFDRKVPCFLLALLEVLGLFIYHKFYPSR